MKVGWDRIGSIYSSIEIRMLILTTQNENNKTIKRSSLISTLVSLDKDSSLCNKGYRDWDFQ